MDNPTDWFHLWGYVTISYGAVLLCCSWLGVSSFLRLKRATKRLDSLEQAFPEKDS